MSTTTYKGIDYGLGQSNIDHETGIRFGVIPQGAVLQAWADSSEGYYGEPCCPKCGNQADSPDKFGDSFADGVPEDYTTERYETDDYVCVYCKHFFGGESAFGDEPLSFVLDDGEYLAESDSSGDIFITKSPYYTRAQFCSPCAPGACYLENPCDNGERAYCFAADWFDDEEPCPYPVYRVADDTLVYTPRETT